jgi:hypothetical protein
VLTLGDCRPADGSLPRGESERPRDVPTNCVLSRRPRDSHLRSTACHSRQPLRKPKQALSISDCQAAVRHRSRGNSANLTPPVAETLASHLEVFRWWLRALLSTRRNAAILYHPAPERPRIRVTPLGSSNGRFECGIPRSGAVRTWLGWRCQRGSNESPTTYAAVVGRR